MNIQTAKNKFTPMSETMLYILMSLIEERHGYGIMQHVKEITNGRIVLGAGTIYQTLRSLKKASLLSPQKKWIEKNFILLLKLASKFYLKKKCELLKLHRIWRG